MHPFTYFLWKRKQILSLLRRWYIQAVCPLMVTIQLGQVHKWDPYLLFHSQDIRRPLSLMNITPYSHQSRLTVGLDDATWWLILVSVWEFTKIYIFLITLNLSSVIYFYANIYVKELLSRWIELLYFLLNTNITKC